MENTLTVYKAKWTEFIKVGSTGKTDKFLVINSESRTTIGEVKWYAPFRQYSFFPNNNTVSERQCLLDITKFVHQLMQERKLKKQLITA